MGARARGTIGRWLKTVTIFSHPALVLRMETKKRPSTGKRLSLFWEFRLFDLAISPPIHFVSEPGSSYLLCFTPQAFLSKPAHLLYYVLPINRFSAPGSSDVLCFADPSFFSEIGSSYLLRFTHQSF